MRDHLHRSRDAAARAGRRDDSHRSELRSEARPHSSARLAARNRAREAAGARRDPADARARGSSVVRFARAAAEEHSALRAAGDREVAAPARPRARRRSRRRAKATRVGGVTIHAAARRIEATATGSIAGEARRTCICSTPARRSSSPATRRSSSDTHHLVERVLWENGRELDLALLPIGYAPWWKPGFRKGHLTHDDALTLFERLRARVFVPYHWGTFRHVTATAHDAIRSTCASASSRIT